MGIQLTLCFPNLYLHLLGVCVYMCRHASLEARWP